MIHYIYNHRHTIWGALAVLAFLALVGTAGAMDTERIGAAQGAIQLIVFLATFVLSLKKSGAFDG
ncbi:hypothetical protein FACS1894208_10480 [Clostridia bacterium]|nr:hypothetical protein FACS1894208_10480 [Clostridia bacterium]